LKENKQTNLEDSHQHDDKSNCHIPHLIYFVVITTTINQQQLINWCWPGIAWPAPEQYWTELEHNAFASQYPNEKQETNLIWNGQFEFRCTGVVGWPSFANCTIPTFDSKRTSI